MSQIMFRIASPQITSEIVDGEIMIINLKNGNYFNLNGSCLEIWTQLQEGASPDRMLALLSRSYQADSALLKSELEKLLGELEREELIAASPGEDSAKLPEDDQTSRPFIPPILSKFSDMQELLLLDPIHDVDDAGWPQAKIN